MSSTSGSTKLVAIAAADAEAAAKESFAAILQRQEEANAVKQKLLLLSRFEALFRLPGRVAQLAGARDFEGVVAEYCKGKKLIPVQDHALWAEVSRRLEDQVDLVFVRPAPGAHVPAIAWTLLLVFVSHGPSSSAQLHQICTSRRSW